MARNSWMGCLKLLTILLVTGAGPCWAEPSAREITSRLFDRIAGIPLSLNDARRVEMELLVAQGRLPEAAAIASADDAFFNVTLKRWATPLSTQEGDPFNNLNDLIAMVIGTARDERDARELLYGNFTYVGHPSIPSLPALASDNNSHYDFLENNVINLRQKLVRVEPQRADIPDAAGVLTSRAWGLAHFNMGTNRRALEYAFQEFLCTPLKEIADTTVNDAYVRRDVDRSPGGSSSTYTKSCRGCHGGLDALDGAFANFEFTNNALIYGSGVQAKMNRNANVYPEGAIVRDDAWINLWTNNQNTSFGWRGSLQGTGAQALGYMLSQSSAFSSCMAKRAFRTLCSRDFTEEEISDIQQVGVTFENSGYNLRRLFEATAILPRCLGNSTGGTP